MARNIHRLSDREIKNASKPLNDGGNLWIYPNGNARGWIFRYMLQGRAREMGLGAYPDVSLAQARKDAAKYRELLQAGIDPIEHRDAKPVEQEAVPTFSDVASQYIEAHGSGWKNAKHAAQWTATLATYAEPVIGTKPVDAIGTEDVLLVLEPIWSSKTETAKRVQGRMENILDFAAARKWRDQSNPARWRGHLDKLLARPTKVSKPVHHPAMDYREVPAFMVELADKDGVSALALRFLILTACRTAEVTGAAWVEIDVEAAVWSIPGSRMKAGQPHRVPLSAPALAILEALPRVEGNPFLFPGARHGRSISNMAMLQQMRGMGYGVGGDRGAYVPHGFRSAFRDWAGEVSSFPRDVCEMALAHVIENKVEAAYRRGDLFEKRRKMMDAWADWCGRGNGAEIIPLREQRTATK
jgi:integrase